MIAFFFFFRIIVNFQSSAVLVTFVRHKNDLLNYSVCSVQSGFLYHYSSFFVAILHMKVVFCSGEYAS